MNSETYNKLADAIDIHCSDSLACKYAAFYLRRDGARALDVAFNSVSLAMTYSPAIQAVCHAISWVLSLQAFGRINNPDYLLLTEFWIKNWLNTAQTGVPPGNYEWHSERNPPMWSCARQDYLTGRTKKLLP